MAISTVSSHTPGVRPNDLPRNFPVASKFGPKPPTTAGPETAPNRNTQRLQRNQIQESQDLAKQQVVQTQLEGNSLPQLGASPTGVLNKAVQQAGLNSKSGLAQMVATSTTKA